MRKDSYEMKYAFYEGGVSYRLLYNPFPYDVAEDVSHMVLWSITPLRKNMISKILDEKISNCEYLYVQLPKKHRSIPGIWHAHVFTKE